MAELEIKDKHVVKPAEATWGGVVALTELDQVAGAAYVPLVYFYKPDTASMHTPIIETLKDSLSRALVHYYPLAGRLHRAGGRLELHCNASGVELIEAESNNQLEDFGDFSDTEKFQHLIPLVDHSKPVHELPLLFVQLTSLRCGGVSLGIMMSHGVADGTSAFYFITDWARLARGEPLEVSPSHDRAILRAGEPPRELPGIEQIMSKLSTIVVQHCVSEEPKETDMVMLPLTKDQVDKLKKAANVDSECNSRPYSRYEVLAAHIWRCTCKARGYESKELKALGIGIDARYRLHKFPEKYFGNTAFVVAARSNVRELLSMPLRYACGKIRQAIESVTEEYVWSEIEFMKRLDDFTICQQLRALRSSEEPYINPSLGVISWLSLPIYGLNFGWGREIHISPGTHKIDGVSLILPAREELGSVSVIISLQVAHIDKFKEHFYADFM